MERNTMGQFIAALRRAVGMTQQEVADRLNVSNKAVSRWERDECSPDLSLIPPLAELFGVSCDELLRGRRSPAQPEPEERRDVRVEKQLHSLICRTLSAFRTLCWLSMAASAVGLVATLAISYAFYRPIIGVAVGLVFVIAAVVLAAIGLNRALDTRRGNELFEQAEPELTRDFDDNVSSLSFRAFFAALSTTLLSLPLLLGTDSGYVESVLSISGYLLLAAGIVLLLICLWLWGRPLYEARLWGQPLPAHEAAPALKTMNRRQLGLVCAGGLILLLAPYLDLYSDQTSVLFLLADVLGLVCLLGALLLFPLTLRRQAQQRRALVLPGLRNVLYIVPALLLAESHGVCWIDGTRYDSWDVSGQYAALGLALLITLLSALAQLLRRRR